MNAYSYFDQGSALAQRVIMEIGEGAVPSLANALSNTNTAIRIHAVDDLGSLRADAVAAVPVLKKALEDKDHGVRHAATNALRLVASVSQVRESENRGRNGRNGE